MWYSITVTYGGRNSIITGGRLYIGDGDCIKLSYNEAMRWLRKVEKKLNRIAELSINPYNPKIFYKTLYGFTD